MSPRVVRLIAAAVALVALHARAAQAQSPFDYFNRDDFSSEVLYATGEVGVGARAMGLGGNYVAIADDATALYWNPAGLAQLVRVEMALGVHTMWRESTHTMFGVEATADANDSGLDHLVFAYPFPTYRGSLVIAGGVLRARSNELETVRLDQRADVTTRFDDSFLRAQTGGLWRWSGGFGVDLTRNLSFGTSFSYWEGGLEDDQLRTIDETGLPLFTDRLQTDSDVDGFSFDLGLLAYAGKRGRLGITVRSPVWLSIEGTGLFTHEEVGNDFSEALFVDDDPRLPWSAVAGGSIGGGILLVTGEVRYTAWEEISGVPRSNREDVPGADPDYTGTVGGGAGVELALPGTPLRFRGGYSFDPQPYTLHLGNPSRLDLDRQRLTAGAGLLLAGSFALDAAYTWTTWTRYDTEFDAVGEKRDERTVYLAGAYRF